MAKRTQTYTIRLAAEGGGQVKAELVSVGQSGEQSLKRIEIAGGEAWAGLVALYSWFCRRRLCLDACPRPTRLPSGTPPGVAGCGHGIVGPEPELFAVGFRRELVRDVEMAPKDFLLLAADQTGEVFVSNRATHRDGGRRFSPRSATAMVFRVT